jgi:hypothetical protein
MSIFMSGHKVLLLVALVSGVQSGPESSGQVSFVQPVFTRPEQDQRLYIQNNGFCFNAKNTQGRHTVDLVEIKQVSRQQVWTYRSDGRINNTEFNKCLSINLDGAMSLCGCEDERANMWDINWERGIFKEKKWNKVIGMRERKVVVKEFSENLRDSECTWTPYAVHENKTAPKRVVTTNLEAKTPICIQQNNNSLVVNKADNRFIVSTVKDPSIFQQQNWMFLDDGRIKNVIFRECLAPLDQRLTLCECDDTSKVGFWEFKKEHGVLVEKKLKKAIAIESSNVVLMEFVETKIAPAMKLEAYRFESIGVQNTIQGTSTIINSATPLAVGVAGMLTLSVGFVWNL